MQFLKCLGGISLLIVSFFLGLLGSLAFIISLIIVRSGYLETGSIFVFVAIPILLTYYAPAIWCLLKAKNLLFEKRKITREEAKQAVKRLYAKG